MTGTNLGERVDEENQRKATSPENLEDPANQPSSADNRIESFRFVFKDRIPEDIWDKILELPPLKRQDLITRSLSEGFLALHDERNDNDTLAIYFRGDIPSHFGKIHGDKIRSKWGNGPVWNHGLWEVPHSYGDRIRYSTGDVDYSVLKRVIETLKTRISKGTNTS